MITQRGTDADVAVLHVDADESIRERVRQFFQERWDRFDVRSVATAVEAKAAIQSDRVDCVVSEHHLPETDGLTFLEGVRADRPDLPFVFFTENGSESLASDALSAGATDYLQKDADESHLSELATRVETAVETARAKTQRTEFLEVIDTAREGIGILDEDGCFVYVNDAYADLYGYDREEMVGMHWEAIYPEDQIGFTEDEVIPELRSVGSWSGETVGKRADGSTFLEDHRIATTGSGQYVCLVRDISETKQQEAALDRTTTVLRTMVANLPVGILVEDAERNVLLANDRLCEMLGVPCSGDELEGADCADAAEEIKDVFADPDGFVEGVEERLATGVAETGEELPMADGRTLERDFIPYELPDGGANLWLYRDVTDKKDHERQLQREVDRLDEFASIVSHDLRNPLNVAQGHLEIAREECHSDHLEPVAGALDRMGSLIDSTLTLARKGQSVDETRPVELSTLVERCWGNVETDAAALHVETSLSVEADPERLQSLFENLFRNSVEHGGEDVSVTVGAIESTGFFVADDGPGVPVDEREDVFRPGYSTDEGGTGFGLAIVETVAQAHGWDVRLTASDGGGARFEFTGVEIV